MQRTLGVIMDPIGSIKFHKDSTLAMLLAAQARGWELRYMELSDLYLTAGEARAVQRRLHVRNDPTDWYSFGDSLDEPLAGLDVLLMRKDPPFDMEYIYSTYLLEDAERRGTLVVNRPVSLRDANEKLFTTRFNHCMPPSLVTRRADQLRAFIEREGSVVLKPLGGMGGASIFRVEAGDPNTGVIIETLTAHGHQYAMAQRFIPEISQGDKRILLIDGEPVPYALARVPAAGEFRGNLAAGGTGHGVALTDRDRWICQQVAPTLREMGLLFVGLDVIGDYLTEVNVTSPTCIRELDEIYGLDIAGDLMNAIDQKLQERISP